MVKRVVLNYRKLTIMRDIEFDRGNRFIEIILLVSALAE